MMNYKKIVVAMELKSKPEDFIVDKVKELIKDNVCEIYLVHAVEHSGSYGSVYGASAGIDIEKALFDDAVEKMSEYANHLNVDQNHQIIKTGVAAETILDEADSVNADLIVIGSHGHHGIRLLLGSTANSVIHGSKRDVLAIRFMP